MRAESASSSVQVTTTGGAATLISCPPSWIDDARPTAQHLVPDVARRQLDGDVVVAGFAAPGAGRKVLSLRIDLRRAVRQHRDLRAHLFADQHLRALGRPEAQAHIANRAAHRVANGGAEIGLHAGRIGNDHGGSQQFLGDLLQLAAAASRCRRRGSRTETPLRALLRAKFTCSSSSSLFLPSVRKSA